MLLQMPVSWLKSYDAYAFLLQPPHCGTGYWWILEMHHLLSLENSPAQDK